MRAAPLMTVSDLDDLPEDGNRYELIGANSFCPERQASRTSLLSEHSSMLSRRT
jgi:hypothetical protein